MRKAKILIVDDRVENLLTLEGLLDTPDIELIRALSGEEALALTLDHDFALVLLDVQMPTMNGYEVAELMRGNKKTKDIPIIFVTASEKNTQQLFKGYESGAVDYLLKPLQPMVLQSKVNVFLQLYQQKEALTQKTVELDQRLVELEELQQQLEETNEQLHLLSITDGLTGLYNKRHFNAMMEEEWSRACRQRTPLSLLWLDIDFFKPYNDTYGHAEGDESLRKVAQALSLSVNRSVDKVARVGGEEFAIILPGTDEEGAKYIMEKIRSTVENLALRHGKSTVSDYITISIGSCSCLPDKKKTISEMTINADKALYRAKDSGRNSTVSTTY